MEGDGDNEDNDVDPDQQESLTTYKEASYNCVLEYMAIQVWQIYHNSNSRVQKYRATYGRVKKVKPANSKAVDGTLSYYYKVQS